MREPRCFDIERRPRGMHCGREARRGTDDDRRHPVSADAHQHALGNPHGLRAAFAAAQGLQLGVDARRRFAQGQLAQSEQILALEEVIRRALGMHAVVNLAGPQARQQLIRRNIDELDVVGRGDQLTQVAVEVPRKLTSKQRELVEALALELGEDVQPEQKSFMDKLRELFG